MKTCKTLKPRRVKISHDGVLINKANFGFNALNNEYCDMVECGIIDPTKVTRSALENAASVASVFLTTESVIADEKEPAAPAMPAGGMGGMY